MFGVILRVNSDVERRSRLEALHFCLAFDTDVVGVGNPDEVNAEIWAGPNIQSLSFHVRGNATFTEAAHGPLVFVPRVPMCRQVKPVSPPVTVVFYVWGQHIGWKHQNNSS